MSNTLLLLFTLDGSFFYTLSYHILIPVHISILLVPLRMVSTAAGSLSPHPTQKADTAPPQAPADLSPFTQACQPISAFGYLPPDLQLVENAHTVLAGHDWTKGRRNGLHLISKGSASSPTGFFGIDDEDDDDLGVGLCGFRGGDDDSTTGLVLSPLVRSPSMPAFTGTTNHHDYYAYNHAWQFAAPIRSHSHRASPQQRKTPPTIYFTSCPFGLSPDPFRYSPNLGDSRAATLSSSQPALYSSSQAAIPRSSHRLAGLELDHTPGSEPHQGPFEPPLQWPVPPTQWFPPMQPPSGSFAEYPASYRLVDLPGAGASATAVPSPQESTASTQKENQNRDGEGIKRSKFALKGRILRSVTNLRKMFGGEGPGGEEKGMGMGTGVQTKTGGMKENEQEGGDRFCRRKGTAVD
ncbi:hypothetical protein BDV98DRAFT_595725 [Pterulicium gracile]|uniref:Uncharacterized protein n=1 Tax=Pterulicium gracile TaxID=1884261 RepID=A0A5C3Q9S6_9AGAR|nr:hypothetical protein BDV98DRAFT_595725 [Pterula gracilis]